MIHLFTCAPVQQRVIPAGQIAKTLQSYQEEGLSGVLQFRCGREPELGLLLVEGMPIYAVQDSDQGPLSISTVQLTERLSFSAVTLRLIVLPAGGVRVAKAILEWYPPVETRPVQSSEVSLLIQEWVAQPVSSVARITWADAEGFLLLPGQLPPSIIFYTTRTGVLWDESALAAMYKRPPGPCTGVRYQGPSQVAASTEVIAPLRAAFAALLLRIIAHYTAIVGQKLAAMLRIDLNTKAVGNGWQIRVTAQAVADTHKFSSPEAAAQVYQLLLNEAEQHIAAVVGAQFARTMFSEAPKRLAPELQAQLQRYRVIKK